LVIKEDTKAHAEFGSYQSDNNLRLHDAGFDAYMTGLVFAMQTKRIEIDTLLTECAASKEEEKKQPTQKGQAKRAQKKAAKDEHKIMVTGGLSSGTPSGAVTPNR